jgi:hypothetical protein
MAISLKNLQVNADELRAKLKAEQDAKEAKAAPKQTYDDLKFKGELIGAKTSYVLRILPNTFNNGGVDEPWEKTFVHMFPNPQGMKKFVLCPTTLDKSAPCPLCERAKVLFAKVNDKTASKADEENARKFYKKPRFFVNVLVVEDPRPIDKGNQKGKVLIWEMGPQVHEKLKEALIDAGKKFHSVMEGFNFNLVIKKKGEHPNYESSFFASDPTPITLNDDELDRISNAIVDVKKFALGKGPRSYDDIKAIMNGTEPERSQKEYDSSTGVTTVKPLNATTLNESVDLDEITQPVATTTAPVTQKQMTDDELLAQLDDLT